MVEKDRDYYRRRMAQEKAAAINSSCPQSRDVHLDLTDRYSAKLRLIDAVFGNRAAEFESDLTTQSPATPGALL